MTPEEQAIEDKKAADAKAAAAAAAATPPGPDGVKKGMHTVAWAAQLLDELASLCSATHYERAYEGDNSKIPDRLKALSAEFGSILADLVTEEVAELSEGHDEAFAIELAAKPGGLKKSESFAQIARAFLKVAGGQGLLVIDPGKDAEVAGAMALPLVAKAIEAEVEKRFSAKTKEALAGIHADLKKAKSHVKKGHVLASEGHDLIGKAHDFLKACGEGMTKLGYEDKGDDAAEGGKDGAGADDKSKDASAAAGELQKVAAERDALRAKLDKGVAFEAGQRLEKVTAERDELQAKLSTAHNSDEIAKAQALGDQARADLEKRLKEQEDIVIKARAELCAAEKRASDAEALNVAADAALKQILEKQDDLNKRLTRANAELATKGSLKAVPIGKASDGAEPTAPVAPAPPNPDEARKLPPEKQSELATSLIKAVQRGGGMHIPDRQR